MKRYKAINFEYDDAYGTGTALDIVEHNEGEFVKYDDIKHLLQNTPSNSDYAVTPTASPKSCANCFWQDKPHISACNGCYDESNWEERT